MSRIITPSINFTDEQYENLRQTYRKWWAGELDRPIVPISTFGHESNRKPTDAPFLTTMNAWDMSIAPEEFIEAYDYHFSKMRWHGDAFPYVSTTQFGPGVLAAFLGCKPVGAETTVWFESDVTDLPISELHFEYDENNPYFQRIIRFYEAAMEKWHGNVVVSMVDMGGNMDVLAWFRSSENLLLDLYDDPDEVKRCINEIQDMWFKCFDRINSIMAPEARGYSQWFRTFHEKPGYVLQSDFSYMISPDMFKEFVAPELTSSAARLDHPVYHMDGIGEIPHLDHLLAIKDLAGIQWVAGDGEPSMRNWDELLTKILASGKKLLSWGMDYTTKKPRHFVKNPGQLFYDERTYKLEWLEDAKKFADIYGIEIKF